MSVIVILILAGALAWLWRRVDRLEREIGSLRSGTAPAAVTPRPAERVGTAAAAASVAAPSEAGPGGAAAALDRPQPANRWRPHFDFEDVFGRLLPIWAGGVTLAVAGFFLVRWSIDAGLLTPPVRVVLAGLFGCALIAGAEAAFRWRERVADPRVAQALAGAGLATLYAAFYLAGSAYGLIGSTFAFLGLAAVTGAAVALSYRFGLPSAVLGVVGGFAAPALVGSEQANMPLLTLYLGLVTAGLALTGQRQGRPWLGMAALAGGLGWGSLLIAGGSARASDIAVLGAYLVVLGAVLPALTGGAGRPLWLVRVGAAALAALQLALLVQQGGFGALEWSLYLLLGAALAWFGWREPAMREANAVAAAVGVALALVWPTPDPRAFAAGCAALAAIFAGAPLAQIGRGHGRPIDLAQVGGVALGLGLAALWHFGSPVPESAHPAMALALFLLACLPAAAIALTWRVRGESVGAVPLAVQAAAALLAFGALAQVLPEDSLAWTAASLAALTAWRARSLTGAIATLAVITAAWALPPLFEWLQAGALALVGTPMTSVDLPALQGAAFDLLPAILGGAAWSAAARAGNGARRAVAGMAVALAAVAVHIVFRHAFAALSGEDFVTTGVLERAAWEALLLTAGWLCWRRRWAKVATGFALAAAAHFAWFTLVLHNPLWSGQAVGAVPVANLLVPAYAVGLAVILVLRRWLAGGAPWVRWALDGAAMAVIAFFCISELRQLFAGSLLAATRVGPQEDLLRSLTGLVLAVGFLLWGARTHERSWRIGSLVLMVIAVLKVFLVDAAGLAGLARIASFMALGFSLIGIGWFYARQLRVTEGGGPSVSAK